MTIDENFHVNAIISKLPPSWKDYKTKLMHKKEDMCLDILVHHLRVEEEYSNRDKKDDNAGKAHVIEELKTSNPSRKVFASKEKNFKKKSKSEKKKEWTGGKKPIRCYTYGKRGHILRNCRSRANFHQNQFINLETPLPHSIVESINAEFFEHILPFKQPSKIVGAKTILLKRKEPENTEPRELKRSIRPLTVDQVRLTVDFDFDKKIDFLSEFILRFFDVLSSSV
ncbi:hypothetical protein ACOSQ4_013914 [Xanthoceras sorbifolium]